MGDVNVLTVNSWSKRAGFFLGRPVVKDLFGQIIEDPPEGGIEAWKRMKEFEPSSTSVEEER